MNDLPMLSPQEYNTRVQGFTIIQAATTVSDSVNLASVLATLRDTNEKLFVIFNCKADYYINLHGAATAPTGDNITGNAPMLNPESVIIPGNITAINFALAAGADNIHMEIFRYGR